MTQGKDKMKEVYKDVENYEGLYQVSNLGNIKALDRYNIDKNGKKKFYPGKQLVPDINRKSKTSYKRVTLCKNGKIKRYQLHQLVAKAFIKNPDNKPYINHIDNNGLNNTVSNLEWCNHSENMVHAQKQGRLFDSQSKAGKKIGNRLRTEAINEINSRLGTTINNYILLSYEGFNKTRHKVLARCTRCSSTSVLAFRHITRGTNTRCYHCRNVKDENLTKWISKRNKI